MLEIKEELGNVIKSVLDTLNKDKEYGYRVLVSEESVVIKYTIFNISSIVDSAKLIELLEETGIASRFLDNHLCAIEALHDNNFYTLTLYPVVKENSLEALLRAFKDKVSP